jgi:hypothetical protein
MFIRTRDGLIHRTAQHETADRYGKTLCERAFTQDPKYMTRNEDISGVKTAKPPITCFYCIAKDSA